MSAPTVSPTPGWSSPFEAVPALAPTPMSAGATPKTTTVVVAQASTDVLDDMVTAFKNFYDSGQLWALIIGIIIGYVIRGVTTYK